MEEIMTIKDVAEKLRVSLSTVNRWIYEGKLKAYKVAGKRTVRIMAKSIESLLSPIQIPKTQNKEKDIQETSNVPFLDIHIYAKNTEIKDLASKHDFYLYNKNLKE